MLEHWQILLHDKRQSDTLIMENRLVSVIMPTYNTGRILSESIDSILCQTYADLELIITDDHSNDAETLAILDRYGRLDKRIKILYLNENHGAGYARNKAIEAASGRYIAFCDSDDRWFPDKLERQMAFIASKGCCLIYSSYIICNQDGQAAGIFISPRIVTYAGMKRDDKIGCLTALYDTSFYGKFYFPLLRKRQDWAMFIMLLQKCRIAYGMKEPLAYYRLRTDSLSSNKRSLVKFNINVYHKILGFSKAKSYLYFGLVFFPTYLAKTIKRKVDSYRYLGKLASTP